jgi:hypothetical protein
MKLLRMLGWMGLLLACGAVRAAPAEAEVATAEEAITKVRAAARLLHDRGASSYADFNQRDSKWVWKDSYVFVYDCRKDRMIAHPMRPDLVGKPIMQITDNTGKPIFKDLCKAGNEARGGWVEYMWQNRTPWRRTFRLPPASRSAPGSTMNRYPSPNWARFSKRCPIPPSIRRCNPPPATVLTARPLRDHRECLPGTASG